MSFKEFVSESSDKKLLNAAKKLIIKMKKAKDNNNKIIKALELNFPSLDADEVLANFKNELVEDDSHLMKEDNLEEKYAVSQGYKAKDELNEAAPGMGNAHGFARSIKDLKDIKKMTQMFKDGRGVQAEYITVADEQFKVYIEYEGKVK